MANKRYLGNGKVNGQYGIINASICLTDLLPEDINEYNGKKYIRISIGEKREVDQYGKTHSVWVNEYNPEQATEAVPESRKSLEKPKTKAVAVEDDALPF